MVAYKNLSLLALAGLAVAAPSPRGGSEVHKHVVWETVVKTAYVTVFPGAPTPAPAPTSSAVVYTPAPTSTKASSSIKKKAHKHSHSSPVSSSAAPVESSTQAPEPVPSSTAVYEESTSATPVPSSTSVYEEPTSAAPVSSSTAVSEEPSSTSTEPTATPTPSASSTDSGYMATVNEWRAKLGLKDLIHSDKLEANALKTCVEGNGQMVHQLNDGSMGQVLAPGEPDDFYHVFVGGWLCEKPDMAGMDGVCETASSGWGYTSTGHADILTSDSYSNIGCGQSTGIWGCDLS